MIYGYWSSDGLAFALSFRVMNDWDIVESRGTAPRTITGRHAELSNGSHCDLTPLENPSITKGDEPETEAEFESAGAGLQPAT